MAARRCSTFARASRITRFEVIEHELTAVQDNKGDNLSDFKYTWESDHEVDVDVFMCCSFVGGNVTVCNTKINVLVHFRVFVILLFLLHWSYLFQMKLYLLVVFTVRLLLNLSIYWYQIFYYKFKLNIWTDF